MYFFLRKGKYHCITQWLIQILFLFPKLQKLIYSRCHDMSTWLYLYFIGMCTINLIHVTTQRKDNKDFLKITNLTFNFFSSIKIFDWRKFVLKTMISGVNGVLLLAIDLVSCFELDFYHFNNLLNLPIRLEIKHEHRTIKFFIYILYIYYF